VGGDEGFEQCVLFDVAWNVETMPFAVERVEYVRIVDGSRTAVVTAYMPWLRALCRTACLP
jgi:hypothetical protein